MNGLAYTFVFPILVAATLIRTAPIEAAVTETSSGNRSISGDANDDDSGTGVSFSHESFANGGYLNSFDLTDSEPFDLNDLARIAAQVFPVSNDPFSASADFSFSFTLSPVSTSAVLPEPASITAWSLLGLIGSVIGWRRRSENKEAAQTLLDL